MRDRTENSKISQKKTHNRKQKTEILKWHEKNDERDAEKVQQ